MNLHALRQQALHAAAQMARYHDILLSLGFEWDGMDGYLSPSAEASAEAARSWEEINRKGTES